MSERQESRLSALDHLRAVACLLVMYGHICFLGCVDLTTVQTWLPSLTAAPYPLSAGNPYAAGVIALSAQAGLNVGHLGMALFFLLTGFVVLRSLDHETAQGFMVGRAFRMLPACGAASVLAMALVAAVCRIDGVADLLTPADGLASATVTMNYLHRMPVVPVLWSLEVGVVFYAMMAVIAWAGRPIGLRALFLAALVTSNLAFVLVGLSRGSDATPEIATQFVHLSQILIYVPLMLVGAAANRCRQAGWRWNSAPRVAAFLAVFASAYSAYGPIAGWDRLGIDATSVTAALVLFFAALVWRQDWRWLTPLRFIGAISYPLYLVHAPLSWGVLAAMARRGFSVHTGCAAAFLVCLAAAWVIHVLVERPARRFGAALTARLRLQPPTGRLVPVRVAA